MLGRDFVDALVDEKNATDVRAAIKAASSANGRALDNKGHEVEFSTRSVDETRPPLDILMHAFTRQDAVGQSGPFGVCCICTDLTESKSKMKAEIRAEETRKFLSTMSHEMRTPLNGVLGMLQLAKDYPLPPAATDYIDGAVRSGEHLLHLINDILDINRIEAGKLATSKGIEIVVAMPEVVPEVYGDPERLQQILLNFLSNGVKFTPDGGRVVVQVRVIERRGRILDVRFDVTDNGVGIREKDQLQLFQRFYRVQDRSREDPGGTGLGLAICREIAERWGGKVGCETKYGSGSTFWVLLPLEVAMPGDSPRAASAEQSARQRRRDASRLSSCSEASSPVSTSFDSRRPGRSASEIYPAGVRHMLPALQLGPRGDALCSGSHASSPAPGSHASSPGPGSPSAGPRSFGLDPPANASIRPTARPAGDGASQHRSTAEANVGVGARIGSLDATVNAAAPATRQQAGTRAGIDGSCGSEKDREAPSPLSGADFKALAASPAGMSPHPELDVDSPMGRATPLPVSLRPCHVLVAEDNQINVRIVRTMLEKAGHVVVVAADGEEAVEAFRRAAANAAEASTSGSAHDSLWAMPRKDGFSATQEIREIEASLGLARHPIVARFLTPTCGSLLTERRR
eukprot:tig00022080_g23786.t1